MLWVTANWCLTTLFDGEGSYRDVTLLDKTYGLPLTMNFPMLFYRLDVLVDLNVSAPKTWDDVLALLPILQSNNLAVGDAGDHPLWLSSQASTFRPSAPDDPPSITERPVSHAVEALPTFAPMMTPTVCASVISPELTKPTTMTVVAELD